MLSQNKLPDAQEIYSYFQLISKNSFDPKYLGELMTGSDPWKILGAIADLKSISSCLEKVLESPSESSYIMTNTGGHHADNAHYELFCPLNQLFYIVEYLNYSVGFPEIMWIDVDAHFGNGDKKLHDGYLQKMSNEQNNVRGISFHNDYVDVDEKYYTGKKYSTDCTNVEYISLLDENIIIPEQTRFLLVFFGTDIVQGDYGNNTNISQDIIPQIVSAIEAKVPPNTRLIYIQTGGSAKSNIIRLISTLVNKQVDLFT